MTDLLTLNAARVGAGVAPFQRSRFFAPVEGLEVRDSGAGDGQWTIRGHAAVFNRLSLDLGGFREEIAPEAFNTVLAGNPDVHMVWDHNTSLTLARTASKTLELRVDPAGLHVWGRVAPTSYASDLRILMERGDIDQMSFAFTIGAEEWRENDAEGIVSRVTNVSGLYDVTVCAQGAYPQTDAQVARSRLQNAYDLGRLASRSRSDDVAPETVGVVDEVPALGDASTRRQLAALRSRARQYT